MKKLYDISKLENGMVVLYKDSRLAQITSLDNQKLLVYQNGDTKPVLSVLCIPSSYSDWWGNVIEIRKPNSRWDFNMKYFDEMNVIWKVRHNMTRFEKYKKEITLDDFIYGRLDSFTCAKCNKLNKFSFSCDNIDCRKYEKEYWNEEIEEGK